MEQSDESEFGEEKLSSERKVQKDRGVKHAGFNYSKMYIAKRN
jgi:hypothetical protein